MFTTTPPHIVLLWLGLGSLLGMLIGLAIIIALVRLLIISFTERLW